MRKPHIITAGVELEGAWKKEQWVSRDHLPGFRTDGTVHAGNEGMIIGEIASPALKPAYLVEWVRRFYPDAVDSSCGFHVHLGPRDDHIYESLINAKFAKGMLDHISAWGKRARIKNPAFWDRLAGQNSFCKRLFAPLAPYQAKPNARFNGVYQDRYTAVNYPFTEHGTIEVRVLPMFKRASVACAAIQAVVSFAEDYAAKQTRFAPTNPLSLVASKRSSAWAESTRQLAAQEDARLRAYLTVHMRLLEGVGAGSLDRFTSVINFNAGSADSNSTERGEVAAY